MIVLSFLIFGFITVTSQTLMLREMLVIFGGNELSIGLILAEWLLGSALGSYISTGFGINKKINFKNAISLSLFFTGIYLLILFPMLSNIRNILNLLPGQSVGLPYLLISSFLAIFPLSFLIGSQFSLGAHWAQSKLVGSLSWKIYLWESMGFMLGGILFTFVLIKVFSAVPLILFISCLAIVFSSILIPRKTVFGLLLAFILAILFYFLIPRLSAYIENYSKEKLYAGFNVLERKDTPYGQITVLEREKEKYLLSDGAVIGTFPGKETENIETFSYIPLLYHQEPSRILVFGGAGKYAMALSKDKRLSTDYIEIDPELMKSVEKLFPIDLNKTRKVNIIYSDGRNYVKKYYSSYDAIFIGFPYPSTISLNRFYTKEFFKDLIKILKPQGLVVFSIPGSIVYVSDEMAALNACLIKTIKSVFPYIKILPENQAIVIVSSVPFKEKKEELLKNFKMFPFETKFLSPGYIEYRADEKKEIDFTNEIGKVKARDSIWRNPINLINKDMMPIAVKNSLIYLYSLSENKSAKILEILYRYLWVLWLVLFAWFLSKKMGVLGTSFSSGAAGMGLQIISIIVLQATAGNIYSLIGILNASFMMGIAVGSIVFSKKQNLVKIRYIEIAFVLWVSLWLGLFYFKIISLVMTIVFSFGSGFLVGFEFPSLVAARKNIVNDSESVSTGKVYALDLLGGCFGALILGILMVPSLGIFKTLFFIIILKITSALWWLRANR
ncbi:MAG: hypothetical protein NT145_04610 [Elusimicrobia bacterium]|nr:hypothetical protein [Elusimicrobiota bacterium]